MGCRTVGCRTVGCRTVGFLVTLPWSTFWIQGPRNGRGGGIGSELKWGATIRYYGCWNGVPKNSKKARNVWRLGAVAMTTLQANAQIGQEQEAPFMNN
jgi:hypothetical protein